MFIKTILETKGADLISVIPGDGVRDVANMFKRERIGFALVRDAKEAVVGSVSERDIVQALAEQGDICDLPVADIMTANIVTCDIDDTVDAARDLMTSRRTRHVIVVDDEEMMGIVSIGDIIKHSLNECQLDTGMMREYITGQGYL